MGREQHAASHTEEVSYFPSQNENKAGRGKIKDRIQKRGKQGILGGGGLQDTLNLNFIPFQDY